MKTDINEEGFLGKWLSGDLTKEELKNLEASDDYLAYKDILRGVERFEKPTIDIEKRLADQKVYNASLKKTKVSKFVKFRTWAYTAAAVILVAFGLKTLLFKEITIQTQMAQTKVITLPDDSVVTLNSDTELKYNQDSFLKDRVLKLSGEAFFDVEKGSSFSVITKNGKVTVLGTEFNVYSREDTIEVQCYEGKVSVTKDHNELILIAGKGVKSIKKEKPFVFEVSNSQPDWVLGKSNFNEVPLERIIQELERKYNIKIKTGDVDLKRIFTGFFTHNDLKTALKTCFEPMNIKYTFERESHIVLKNK